MGRKQITAVLFFAAIALCGVVYFGVGKIFYPGGVYEFFYSRGLYQPLSLTFFFFGLLLVLYRWIAFRKEIASPDVELADEVITRASAATLANQIGRRQGLTLQGRRMADLLRGCARGEEIGSLEERLKAKDRNELDQSASLIGWVRSLPPLIGLLGTLDGLRGGIAEISMISNANDLDALRSRLQLFAHHASTAFDTTLLGISAAAALSAAIFLVRKTEDTYLAHIDSIADDLARRFAHDLEVGDEMTKAVATLLDRVRQHFEDLLVAATGPVVEEFSKQLQAGVSDAVKRWTEVWGSELSRTSKDVLDSIETLGATNIAALHETVATLGATLRAVEEATARPHPIQIHISQDGSRAESASNGR